MERVTIREVAATAGVAVSTVSAVLNDSSGVRVASTTRSRVLQAVEVLGYEPHHAARALRGKELGAVVVIEDDISTGPYGGQMLAGVYDVCGDLGVPAFGVSTGGDPKRERDAMAFARTLRARAVVLASVAEAVRDPAELRDVVLLHGRSRDDDVPGVVPDNEALSAAAVRELLAFGHRRIGLLTIGPSEPADRRLHAARKAISATRGADALADELVVRMSNVEATAVGGREAAGRLLDLAEPPTGIACFNDRMAMGAYQAVTERGWSVPLDVSVVGFDDLEPIAESLDPGLTTVALPQREMGQVAALLALGLDVATVAGPVEVSYTAEQLTVTGSTVRVRCPVVVRGSVGVPRAARRLPDRAGSA